MADPFKARTSRALLPLAAAFALAACGGGEDTETTYETDVRDLSGGELIVTEETPGAPPVELPETPMTPVPDAPATPEPAPTEPPPAQ